MELLIKDSEIAKTDIPYPEARCRPNGGEGVGADQKPQQVMMDELGQGEKTEVAALHSYFAHTFRKGQSLEKSISPSGHTDGTLSRENSYLFSFVEYPV
ncbi:MAG: hypothetical protein OEV77_06920, partial [Nitrospira sp.]|nr:hypothetical protein [Nitrospira sp.]